MRDAAKKLANERVGKPLEDFISAEEAKHTDWKNWVCTECGVTNVDVISKQCQNCGRDFLGRPGNRPPRSDRLMKPGLRNDASDGFTKEAYDAEFG